jgi:N-acetylneuraminic acid mutarotase/glucose/arabinose dehydrogenase
MDLRNALLVIKNGLHRIIPRVGLAMIVLLFSSLIGSVWSAEAVSIRISAGSEAYTDSAGQTWEADRDFTAGKTFSNTEPIAGTTDDALYQSERFGTFAYEIPVANGTYTVTLHFAETHLDGAGERIFDVHAEGSLEIDDLDIFTQVGQFTALTRSFDVSVNDGILNLDFLASVDNATIAALEIIDAQGHGGHPFLHVVIDVPTLVVDYDGNGSEMVTLLGNESHTHELGHQLVAWTWTEGPTVLGTASDLVVPLNVGHHTLTLTIEDDNVPPETLSDSVKIDVFPIHAVGGALTTYYPTNGIPLSDLIDNLPSASGFIEVLPSLRVEQLNGNIGGSPFSDNVVVVMEGKLDISTSATYKFVLNGGAQNRLYLDGVLIAGPISLTAGTYHVEARFAIDTLGVLPTEALVSLNGAPPVPINSTNLTHDETSLLPFINNMPTSGPASGGNLVTIEGIGFFPSGSVTLHWGNTNFVEPDITVSPNSITLLLPPGIGSIPVTVETPNGVSPSASFTYDTALVPIAFNTEVVANPKAPTQAAWGPDGRLYVGAISGDITIYTFDDDYQVLDEQQVTTIAALANHTILGVAFNPFDPPNPIRIYVAHSQLYANGGDCFSGASAYTGQVSVLEGPDFSVVQPFITGLSASNHDHAVNGMAFDNHGDLLIAVGGNTNAGVPHCKMGGLPESPLSAAILKAHVSAPSFNGIIEYEETATGLLNNDQVFGDIVDIVPGVDVFVFAPGFRNPFDIVWTTRNRLYGTDNGQNKSFGEASTSATTQELAPKSRPDEILLIEEAHYYGHPNRNRGRFDARQNVYRDPLEPSIPGEYTTPLATVDASSNGIDEYRATTFNSQMRGNLLVQKWKGVLYNVQLSADGEAVVMLDTLPGGPSGLDVLTGPGGAIIGIDYSSDTVTVSRAIDAAVVGMTAYDIFPWRAKADGSIIFTIGGVGFGSLADTTVTIGGTPAVLTSVSPIRIHGMIPAQASPTGNLIDVVVQSAGEESMIPKAFQYLLNPGTTTVRLNSGGEAYTDRTGQVWSSEKEFTSGDIFSTGQATAETSDDALYQIERWGTFSYQIPVDNGTYEVISPLPPSLGVWEAGSIMPQALGEVAAGIISGVLYVVGQGSSATLAFDLTAGTWRDDLAVRPFVGHHHAAEVINGNLYLFGGLKGDSQGKVQIYDPLTDSWSLGADVPFATGSASSALINGLVYLAGGIIGSSTVNTAAVYDPVADIWSLIAPMPQGRNHTAAGTDGERFYIFGGRGPGSGDNNTVAEGFDDVMIYDPVTDTWESSFDPGSYVPPLPQKRGGMGKAAFLDGVFYVIGGETTSLGTGQVQGNVYNRVDVYDPISMTWREAAVLPTARHGIFPISYDGKIFIAGGGTKAGGSASKVFEVFLQP